MISPGSDIPLRVALVSREFPPSPRAAGIGTYVYETARGLAARGHFVFVLCAADDNSQVGVTTSGRITVIRLPNPDYVVEASLYGRIRNKVLQWTRYIKYRDAVAATLVELVDGGHIDIVEFPEFGSESARWLQRSNNKIPWIVRLHGPTLLDRKNGRMKFFSWSLRKMIHGRAELKWIGRANSITSCSAALAKVVGRFEPRCLSATIIPNSVSSDFGGELERFQQNEMSRSNTHTKIVIFSAGSITEEKGYLLLLREIVELRRKGASIELHLAGRLGRAGRQILSYSRSTKKNDNLWLKVLGPTERDGLPRLYRQADVVVIPSLWEPFGIVCIEAMSCGGLVLASEKGGMSEIIKDGENGYLYDPFEVGALSRKLKLIHDLTLGERIKIREAARESVTNNFSTAVVMQQQISHYCGLIERHKR